mmetsp:Transcript_10569/g.21278  ORF Transcript_10569/g.21278 Transcript_10569/m.21278 type:complete len:81 (+) Transcript_10569:382-624(+)
MGTKTTMDALVTVKTRTGSFYRRVGSVGEFRTQSFIDQIHFGLGNATQVLSVNMKLMTGEVFVAGPFRVNQFISPIWKLS